MLMRVSRGFFCGGDSFLVATWEFPKTPRKPFPASLNLGGTMD